MRYYFLILISLVSMNSLATDRYQQKLASGETASVLAKLQGNYVSYYLEVAKSPPLLLIKIYKTQQLNGKEAVGFVKISDQNTARKRILFRLAINSAASGTGRGQCGAGIEEYLYIVEVDKPARALTTLHRIPLESCWADISLNSEPDSVQVVHDKPRNESLVQIKYESHPRWERPITVTYSLDSDYFNFESRK